MIGWLVWMLTWVVGAADRTELGDAFPACSLIVPTRGRPALVVDTVRSILAGTRVPTECIIVDQSDSPNAELAAIDDPRCEVRVIQTPTKGLSKGRNIGLAEAKHDVIVLADDDVLPERTWLETLVGALVREGEGAVVTGKVVAGPPEVPGAFAPSVTPATEYATFTGRLVRDPLCTHNCALHRNLLSEVGVFDERMGNGSRFRSAEDNDLGYRLLAAGHRIVTVPDAVMVHRAWRAQGSYSRDIRWRYGIGQGAFYVKHMSRRDPWMLARMIADLNGKNPFRRGRDTLYSIGLLSGAALWAVQERLLPRLRGDKVAFTSWSDPSDEPFRIRSWVAFRRARRRAEQEVARAGRGRP